MKKLFVLLLCLVCLTGCVKDPEDIPTDPVPIPTEAPTENATEEITCVAPGQPTDPATMTGAPELSVLCGGEAVSAMSGGLTWVTAMPDGTTAVICADALHPLEMQKYLTVLETAESSAQLRFADGDTEVFPGELYVAAWSFDCTPDCDGLPFEVAVRGDGTLELLPGKYIYVVQSKWGDGQTSGGTVTHVFCAERWYTADE